MTAATPFSALVLAGSRRGEGDPVARYRGVRHKCLATAGGLPLLVRVVRALLASPRIGEVLVSLDDPALLDQLPELAALRDTGRLRLLTSAASLSRSVGDAFAASGAPLLVTTADHALLEPRMLEQFMAAAEASGADVAAGLVSAATITACYPETRRTYLRFRDGGWSGANLFALRTARAAQGIAFWARLERDRKHPWRLARALGPHFLLAYLLRIWTLDQAMARASRRLGLEAVAVPIPFAEAAIDVDKPADLDLVETILARRSAA
jgi:CTP:molybdopterin cytidylyltransferase MocA